MGSVSQDLSHYYMIIILCLTSISPDSTSDWLTSGSDSLSVVCLNIAFAPWCCNPTTLERSTRHIWGWLNTARHKKVWFAVVGRHHPVFGVPNDWDRYATNQCGRGCLKEVTKSYCLWEHCTIKSYCDLKQWKTLWGEEGWAKRKASQGRQVSSDH